MKTVVVDFSNLDDLSGFGEIARNYAPRLSQAAAGMADMHFVFILPEKHRGRFGLHIDYLSREHLKSEARAYSGPIHLWHATHQQFRYRLRRKGILQLLTVHDLNYLHEKHGIHLLKHQLKMPWMIRRSDAVTVISEYVKNDVEQHVPLLNKELHVIYNGISDVESQPRQRPSFVQDDKAPFFLCIGHVREKKNIHTVVPMMKYFPHHQLYICGANHWTYSDHIRGMIAAEDKSRIVLTGKISNEEKCWLFAHADALLFPSRLEGFGIPVLEAMRFGTKVFSSRYSCLPEVCSTHASYWDDYSPEAMARVVRKGLEGWSRDGAEAMQARTYSLSFNYERYTEQYIALYRQMLKSKLA
jgi:glycosyltransferase involved in cell wall biosynthesis